MLCYTFIVKLSVHEMDCLRDETVPVPGCFGAHCSVAPTRQQFNSIQVYLYSAFYDTIVAKRSTVN